MGLRRDPDHRGAGEPRQQARHSGHRRGRRDPDHLPYREPYLRRLRRTAPASGPCDRRYGGRPFLPALRHRHPESVPRPVQDAPLPRFQPGRRFHHHPAAGEDALSPQGTRFQTGHGLDQTPRVDHRGETRAQLYEGGNRGHVPERRVLRVQLLRHPVGFPAVLRQESHRPEGGGERRPGGHGEQAHPL